MRIRSCVYIYSSRADLQFSGHPQACQAVHCIVNLLFQLPCTVFMMPKVLGPKFKFVFFYKIRIGEQEKLAAQVCNATPSGRAGTRCADTVCVAHADVMASSDWSSLEPDILHQVVTLLSNEEIVSTSVLPEKRCLCSLQVVCRYWRNRARKLSSCHSRHVSQYAATYTTYSTCRTICWISTIDSRQRFATGNVAAQI